MSRASITFPSDGIGVQGLNKGVLWELIIVVLPPVAPDCHPIVSVAPYNSTLTEASRGVDKQRGDL